MTKRGRKDTYTKLVRDTGLARLYPVCLYLGRSASQPAGPPIRYLSTYICTDCPGKRRYISCFLCNCVGAMSSHPMDMGAFRSGGLINARTENCTWVECILHCIVLYRRLAFAFQPLPVPSHGQLYTDLTCCGNPEEPMQERIEEDTGPHGTGEVEGRQAIHTDRPIDRGGTEAVAMSHIANPEPRVVGAIPLILVQRSAASWPGHMAQQLGQGLLKPVPQYTPIYIRPLVL